MTVHDILNRPVSEGDLVAYVTRPSPSVRETADSVLVDVSVPLMKTARVAKIEMSSAFGFVAHQYRVTLDDGGTAIGTRATGWNLVLVSGPVETWALGFLTKDEIHRITTISGSLAAMLDEDPGPDTGERPRLYRLTTPPVPTHYWSWADHKWEPILG